MDCNIPSPTDWGAEGLQNPGKCSPGTSISLKLGSNQFAKQICKAKKSLAFEVLKSVEYHRRCDLAAEICYGSSEADLRKTSQPGSAEVPSRRQKPGARCSSTAATWDSKSSSLESASLTTDRFFSQRLMVSNLSAKFQVKKRKLIRNMKRLPPVSWRSSKTDVSLSLSLSLQICTSEMLTASVHTWKSSLTGASARGRPVSASWPRKIWMIPTPFRTSGAKLHLFIW